MAEGFIDDKGVFHSFDGCVDLVTIRSVRTGNDYGLAIGVSPLVLETREIRDKVAKQLRLFATKIKKNQIKWSAES